MSQPCCSTWNGNQLIAETALMTLRLDGYPVRLGHALVVPKRHVDRFAELTGSELLDAHALIAAYCHTSHADDFTIAINDGPSAGRTVAHLHIHVIPRRTGDMPDPRGGIRAMFVERQSDPWLNR